MNNKLKMLLAVAIAAAGIILAGRQLWRGGRPVVETAADTAVLSESAKVLFDPAVIDTHPTKETIKSVINDIGETVDDRLSEIPGRSKLTTAQKNDLKKVIEELYQNLLDPDFDNMFASIKERGYQGTREQALVAYQKPGGYEHYQVLSPLAIKQLDARILSIHGKGVTDELGKEIGAPRTISFRSQQLRVPTVKKNGIAWPDPIGAGWDVVEVTIPMPREYLEMQNGEMALSGHTRIMLIGYRLAWNKKLKKWIPYCGLMYQSPKAKTPCVSIKLFGG